MDAAATVRAAPTRRGPRVSSRGTGAVLLVPRLGDVGRLEEAGGESAAPRGEGWDAGRACLFAGALAMLSAAAAAGWLHGMRFGRVAVDERVIREAVEKTPVDQIHDAWLQLEQKGLARLPWADEHRIQKRAEALGGTETVAWIVAAAGGVLALVGGVMLAARGRRAANAGSG